MVHYVRFLKLPKAVKHQGNILIKALITITTDLGDSFYEGSVTLTASIRGKDHDAVYLQRKIQWDAPSRALNIELLVKDGDNGWPAQLQVGIDNGEATDYIGSNHIPAIISVWSGNFSLSGQDESTNFVQRRFGLLNKNVLVIWEESVESIARHIWDAGLALLAHLNHTITPQQASTGAIGQLLAQAAQRKLAVLELGSGTGIVGIGFAQMLPNCEVLLTDLKEAEDIIARNSDASTPSMSSSTSFCVLDWEEVVPKSITDRHFDLIFVSDCTYNSDSIPALVRTLSALAKSSPGAVTIISTKPRHSSEAIFFDLMTDSGFSINDHTTTTLPVMQHPDDEETLETVHIYVFERRWTTGFG
ncbi:MAG: hypothetical protein M1830_003757 [Pleopsidium flavum]|nr:MAG: hypothetical protein M1830_003757 [Pleopsidium flavum]